MIEREEKPFAAVKSSRSSAWSPIAIAGCGCGLEAWEIMPKGMLARENCEVGEIWNQESKAIVRIYVLCSVLVDPLPTRSSLVIVCGRGCLMVCLQSPVLALAVRKCVSCCLVALSRPMKKRQVLRYCLVCQRTFARQFRMCDDHATPSLMLTIPTRTTPQRGTSIGNAEMTLILYVRRIGSGNAPQ